MKSSSVETLDTTINSSNNSFDSGLDVSSNGLIATYEINITGTLSSPDTYSTGEVLMQIFPSFTGGDYTSISDNCISEMTIPPSMTDTMDVTINFPVDCLAFKKLFMKVTNGFAHSIDIVINAYIVS